MSELTAEQFAQLAFHLNLLDEQQLNRAWSDLGTRDVPSEVLHQHLVGANLLTNFQIERMLKGERGGYFYGDYKVLYLVGAGTFSRVYRAVHKDSGKVVAVKVLRRRYSQEPDKVAQFVHEASMGSRLRHPNIVPVYEYYSHGNRHYMVMDFVEGQTLREFLKIRRKFEPLEASQLMLGVANGLGYAFEKGITHRDLKLTNVLVSSRGQPKLVDFGLAAADKSRGAAKDEISDVENPRTIDYAGLERATGVRKDDPRSDVYFTGCIYYHLLTGKPPLTETKNRVERLSKSRFTDVPPIVKVDPGLPAMVVHIVQRAMDLDPEKRYQSPLELAGDLNVAVERLSAGSNHPTAEDASKLEQVGEELREQRNASFAGPKATVLFVEPNLKSQDLFRGQLKRMGFRVLIMSDPARALARFNDDGPPADCIIFSSRDLGPAAVNSFNACSSNRHTRDVSALLLLEAKHAAWEEKARKAPHRAVVTMPIKLKEFQEVLESLTVRRQEQIANSHDS
jgi:serine/threonine protein kinase